MSETKQQALSKMLEEMNIEHSSTEDYIHNWLCDQEDDELFECILKEGKSIKNSLNYLTEQARKGTKSNTAVMSDEEGFKIIVDYFKSKETVVKSYGTVSNKEIKVTDETPNVIKAMAKLKAKKEAKKDDSQMLSIFDFGAEELDPIDEVVEVVDDTDYEDDYENE
jgi:hypothetical protein